MKIEQKERMIFDFFHITALKYLAKLEPKKYVIMEGRTAKVYAVYDKSETIPEIKDFKITLNGKELTLQEFSIFFRDTKIELQNMLKGNQESTNHDKQKTFSD